MKSKIRLMFIALSAVLTLAVGACNPSEEAPRLPQTPAGTDGEPSEEPEQPEIPETMNHNLTITIGSTSFAALLEENAAARAFAGLLPLEVRMDELNGNEKYTYLSNSLPTSSSAPGRIETGDLMLWGSDCLVLFYASFPTSYSYTRIGRIIDPAGLAAAVGNGSVTVRFESASPQN